MLVACVIYRFGFMRANLFERINIILLVRVRVRNLFERMNLCELLVREAIQIILFQQRIVMNVVLKFSHI